MPTRLKSLVLCLILAAIPSPLRADDSDVQRIISAGQTGNQVMQDLDWLTNRIGPRLTSSDNLQDAVEWARDRFKEEGLNSARLEEWGEFPVGFNRGPWFGKVIAPEPRALEFGTNAWTAGTQGVVRGHAVLAPKNDEQLEAVKEKLPGAWVLTADAGSPRLGQELLASSTRPSAVFQRKLDAAYEEAHIAGMVRPTRTDLVVTGGNHRISWDKLPTTPQINLVRKQFDEIANWLKDGKDVTLEFDIRNHFKKGPIKLYNVIADIPGTEHPEEFVIIGGHIDSWDGATGATDNGTGCATTLEAARILIASGVKPKRTIRFMLWSGEEQGLFGSKAYVKAHPELIPKFSVVLVHDGGTNYLSGITGTAAMQADFQQVFAPILNLDSTMPFAIRKVNGLSTGGASDHASFTAAGAPGIFWNQAGKAVYNHTHHTQYDTYDQAIPDYQKHSSIVLAVGAYGIANLDHLLSRENLIARGGGGRGGQFGNRRLLGVQMDDLKVTDIEPGSVFDKAGGKVGDTLVSINGTKIGDRSEIAQLLQAATPKSKMTVTRDGKEVDLSLEFPVAATQAQ
jgi:carboxypeptidase Q